MLREPLLASAFFFSLFLVIIVYARFDFTISAVSFFFELPVILDEIYVFFRIQ